MTIGKKTNRYKPPYTLLKTGRGRGGRGQLGFYLLAGLSVLLTGRGGPFSTIWGPSRAQGTPRFLRHR